MTQALKVGPRDKVLEVGTGSGYQAVILSQLARRVYTVERHRPLVREATRLFQELDLSNITPILADGSHGLPDQPRLIALSSPQPQKIRPEPCYLS